MNSYYVVRAYFRHLLRAIPARNAPFYFVAAFSHSQNFTFACFLGWFHLRIALNLPKYTLFINSACMPCLSKICLDRVNLRLVSSCRF